MSGLLKFDKGYDIGAAVRNLNAGLEVRRACWSDKTFLRMVQTQEPKYTEDGVVHRCQTLFIFSTRITGPKGIVRTRRRRWDPTVADLFATDWETY